MKKIYREILISTISGMIGGALLVSAVLFVA